MTPEKELLIKEIEAAFAKFEPLFKEDDPLKLCFIESGKAAVKYADSIREKLNFDEIIIKVISQILEEKKGKKDPDFALRNEVWSRVCDLMSESIDNLYHTKQLKKFDTVNSCGYELILKNKMKKILIIDIETTGFLQAKGQIVEIGIVELDLENGARVKLYDKVMKEKTTTLEQIEKAWIIENSDLTVKEIFEAPFLEDIKPEIQKIIDSCELGATAYNNKFDFDFLENRGFVFPNKLACPMLLSTNICKLPSSRGGYKWPKVQEAYDYFFGKTDYIEKHRGADDAMHEAEIVFELYKRGVFKLK